MICRLQPEGRLSGAVVHGRLAYLVGQVVDDATLDAKGLVADLLRQIEVSLAEAGMSKAGLLNVWLVCVASDYFRPFSVSQHFSTDHVWMA